MRGDLAEANAVVGVPRETWTQKDWYDPTNVLNVPNFLKKVDHNGADTTEIKCPLYSRCPHNCCMHDLDVTVRVIEYLIHSNPHSSADLEGPLHFQELVQNLEIWNIDILYE